MCTHRKLRWGRVAGVALILGAVILTSGYVINSNAEVASPRYGFVEHVVTPGETLWGIAVQYSNKDEDIRDIIYEIKADNNLENNSYLQIGQVLKIRLGNKK